MNFLALVMILTLNDRPLDQYAPVLQTTLDRSIPIDPEKGYAIKKVKSDIYVLTDGIWQSAAVVTQSGVVLIDAPESYGQHIVRAVQEVTDQPIVILIYSHAHSDHIGGSQHLSGIKNLEIVALEGVAAFLREQKDPRRLIPTKTFQAAYVLQIGGKRSHLTAPLSYHAHEGDLFISIPDDKFLMVIDVLAPGYVPFKNLDLSTNVHQYLQVFDQILAYDFDVFVGGHLTSIGDRQDVLTTKAYVQDLYETVARVHANTNMMAVMAEAAKEVGWDNKYLLFKVFLDKVIEDSAQEINARWVNRLAGVDVWSHSHAAKMLEYVRWDD